MGGATSFADNSALFGGVLCATDVVAGFVVLVQ